MRNALRQRKQKRQPRVPEGIRVYAIGDIHGRADLLDQTLNRIDADLASNPARVGIEVFLISTVAPLHVTSLTVLWRATNHFGRFFSKAITRAF
jgi:hypothetical protein